MCEFQACPNRDRDTRDVALSQLVEFLGLWPETWLPDECFLFRWPLCIWDKARPVGLFEETHL